MDLFAPSYFLKFRCLADTCTHNCCRAGWEIDVDKERREAEEALSELAKQQSEREYKLHKLMLNNAINNLKVKQKTTIN